MAFWRAQRVRARRCACCVVAWHGWRIRRHRSAANVGASLRRILETCWLPPRRLWPISWTRQRAPGPERRVGEGGHLGKRDGWVGGGHLGQSDGWVEVVTWARVMTGWRWAPRPERWMGGVGTWAREMDGWGVVTWAREMGGCSVLASRPPTRQIGG